MEKPEEASERLKEETTDKLQKETQEECAVSANTAALCVGLIAGQFNKFMKPLGDRIFGGN